MLDFEQEWKWYDKTTSNPSRCSSKSVCKVFHSHRIEISHMIIDVIENKYQEIRKNEGNLRCKNRESVTAACLFYTYQELGEIRTVDYIRNLFNLKRKDMFYGIDRYMKTFPESNYIDITPEKLLPWMMKLIEVDTSHYKQILFITRYLANTSKLLERSNPQSVAACIIYFYLCLNKDIRVKKTMFAKKSKISTNTINNMLKKL